MEGEKEIKMEIGQKKVGICKYSQVVMAVFSLNSAKQRLLALGDNMWDIEAKTVDIS